MTTIRVFAPLDGVVLDLAEVPDQIFAQKMVGDGLAIRPEGSLAVAPVAGTLLKLFPGGHAFGIVTAEGAELIVHIGLDTIELKGKGFSNIAHEGQQVEVGTPIVRFDIATIEQEGKVVVSPVVSTGSGRVVERASGNVRGGQDVLFVLEL
jgi:PTS system glucose-specific IIA component